jgi:hypothetical protein
MKVWVYPRHRVWMPGDQLVGGWPAWMLMCYDVARP